MPFCHLRFRSTSELPEADSVPAIRRRIPGFRLHTCCFEYSLFLRSHSTSFIASVEHLGAFGDDHIESLRAAEKEAKIIYDSGWRALFGAKPDLYLYALILLLFAGIYPFEYKGGMDRLLPSVKHGGYTLDRTKFLTAATVSALLFLIFTATDLAFIIRQYPLEMLSAPSLSVIGIPIQTNAPLILYAILFEFRRMLGFVLLSVTVCVASKLLRKPYLIIPAVTVLTLLPHMLIDDLPWWMDFTSLL